MLPSGENWGLSSLYCPFVTVIHSASLPAMPSPHRSNHDLSLLRVQNLLNTTQRSSQEKYA